MRDYDPPSKETSKSGTVGFADGIAPQSRMSDEKRSEHLMRKNRFSKTGAGLRSPFFFVLFPSTFSFILLSAGKKKKRKWTKNSVRSISVVEETAGFRTKVCAKAQPKSLVITAQTRSSAERLSGSESVEEWKQLNSEPRFAPKYSCSRLISPRKHVQAQSA